MTRLQWLVLGAAVALFLVLYFGFDTRAFQNEEDIPGGDEAQQTNLVDWQINKYKKRAMDTLSPDKRDLIQAMEYRAQEAENDSAKAVELKKLSAKWYDLGLLHLAGLYAERVAQTTPVDSTWAMAGTTYSLAIRNMNDQELVDFSAKRARHAFEQAISLDPDEVRHRMNLALTYTLRPESGDPMKGVRMLVELNRKYPENVSVLTALGRLSLQTGQLDKAVERLGRAIAIDSSHVKANCLLSTVYSEKGNFALANEYRERCSELRLNQ